MKVVIDDKLHEASQTAVNILIKVAKDKYRSEKKHAIVAVEQKGIIEMRKDEFATSRLLDQARRYHKANGFKVYYVRR